MFCVAIPADGFAGSLTANSRPKTGYIQREGLKQAKRLTAE
jgi:hypothetical protein